MLPLPMRERAFGSFKASPIAGQANSIPPAVDMCVRQVEGMAMHTMRLLGMVCGGSDSTSDVHLLGYSFEVTGVATLGIPAQMVQYKLRRHFTITGFVGESMSIPRHPINIKLSIASGRQGCLPLPTFIIPPFLDVQPNAFSRRQSTTWPSPCCRLTVSQPATVMGTAIAAGFRWVRAANDGAHS